MPGVGGIGLALRKMYARRVYENIESFSKNKSLGELEEIINKYRSKNFILRFFDENSDERADYEASKAVINMRKLEINEFPLKREDTTFYGLIGKLIELESEVKKLNKRKI